MYVAPFERTKRATVVRWLGVVDGTRKLDPSHRKDKKEKAECKNILANTL